MSGAPHNPADRLPPQWLRVPWPVAERVLAFVSTRDGGVSQAPYDSLNLGLHVGDRVADVQENRRRLMQVLPAGVSLQWLEQVHGTAVVDLAPAETYPPADAATSRHAGLACTIMTADCLPVLLCDRAGTVVAAAHAGWRGLCAGVLENTVAAMGVAPAQVLAWLGAAIGPQAFEVGSEVRDAFVACDPAAAQAFCRASSDEKWIADIYRLARLRLARSGVLSVFGGGACTVNEPGRFYSYRRDGTTGRMAAMVWLAAGDA